MEKQIWKPGTLLSPVPPAIVTCGSMERPNLLTVAWTGIVNSNPPMTYVSIRPERYSYGLIKESGEFAINLTTGALVRAADFCGVRSGKDLDKFEAVHLHPQKAEKISAPLLAESPLSLECRVVKALPLGSHEMFLAEIVAVQVDASLVDENGRLNLGKCNLAAYAHGEYFALGKRIGTFGFSVKKRRRSPPSRKKQAK
ncbi:MAG: flavin reductase family protein [Clostridiales bacterium]|uniref:flavin reductase family protein n=1 Tax=Provencibacterium massiliense TaxID=1841868 RepID=UPI0009A5C767|nr:flavin reductase family protein [Provencibacterium massiliense]PWM39335.1 MAG: flavin reductase family protein [Clostridiales bacterium]RGB67534.1 flavin reductase family protein [Harryflintia acetispora]